MQIHNAIAHLTQHLVDRMGEKISSVSADESRGEFVINCTFSSLPEICGALFNNLHYSFATMIVEESLPIRYIFYGDGIVVHVLTTMSERDRTLPSLTGQFHAADWHEREAEDLWGINFKGHPRLGEFVLHEEWPDGVNPMRPSFDGHKPYPHRQIDSRWQPATILQAEGSFLMPIGPIFSDFAESAHFLLETVGEDVLHTIPRFFYKYRGVEKIAENKSVSDVLLLAERFAGTSAFAHSLAFCHAVERLCSISVPWRATALRIFLAELERIRHHVAGIAGICSSTGLAVATSQMSVLEEELLRLTCTLTGHRYFFGMNVIGGLPQDISDDAVKSAVMRLSQIVGELNLLFDMLKVSGSFLDRIEEVGIVTEEKARSLGLVGPIARASGVPIDLRTSLPYGGYATAPQLSVPQESEGDGYARLRVLMQEIESSGTIISRITAKMPDGPVKAGAIRFVSGSALGWSEAPLGASFHWIRIDKNGTVLRYRITPPSFTNWLGFHAAAENFAFQDFPIIMATFGLSNAECDR
ncbi:MAG TPA: NADH-quinone oxidoreductase subunit C [Bacteroidota bacterium]|nr:NADH-quinone oxidoreductase subunit C [Bacteroidota bacterium]